VSKWHRIRKAERACRRTRFASSRRWRISGLGIVDEEHDSSKAGSTASLPRPRRSRDGGPAREPAVVPRFRTPSLETCTRPPRKYQRMNSASE